tara:strand:- start:226 stop:588 length:363 start_codon:yes stop_codon:yes gene_type:complete
MDTHIRLCLGLVLSFVLVGISQYFSGYVPLVVSVPTVIFGIAVMVVAVTRWVFDVYYYNIYISNLSRLTRTVIELQENLARHEQQIALLQELAEGRCLTSDEYETLRTGLPHQDGALVNE